MPSAVPDVPAGGLRAKGGVLLPAAGGRHWVDRPPLTAGRYESRDPGAALGLDPHHHVPRHDPGLGMAVVQVLGQQLV
jgi:hypothetical protein